MNSTLGLAAVEPSAIFGRSEYSHRLFQRLMNMPFGWEYPRVGILFPDPAKINRNAVRRYMRFSEIAIGKEAVESLLRRCDWALATRKTQASFQGYFFKFQTCSAEIFMDGISFPVDYLREITGLKRSATRWELVNGFFAEVSQ